MKSLSVRLIEISDVLSLDVSAFVSSLLIAVEGFNSASAVSATTITVASEGLA